MTCMRSFFFALLERVLDWVWHCTAQMEGRFIVRRAFHSRILSSTAKGGDAVTPGGLGKPQLSQRRNWDIRSTERCQMKRGDSKEVLQVSVRCSVSVGKRIVSVNCCFKRALVWQTVADAKPLQHELEAIECVDVKNTTDKYTAAGC